MFLVRQVLLNQILFDWFVMRLDSRSLDLMSYTYSPFKVSLYLTIS